MTVTLNTVAILGANPSSTQTGYPSAEYEDLGLKIKATPRMHADDEVTLQLEFDIKSLTGSSINGIPILSNRNIEQTIRLRENETSILSGILQSNEIRSTRGLPWTSTEPGVGLLTGENTANIQQTELLILVTPRAMRLPPHEFPAVYAGRGEPATPAQRRRRSRHPVGRSRDSPERLIRTSRHNQAGHHLVPGFSPGRLPGPLSRRRSCHSSNRINNSTCQRNSSDEEKSPQLR